MRLCGVLPLCGESSGGKSSLSRRAVPAPAFGVHGSQYASNHYSPKSWRRLRAAVYSVGGAMRLDRSNMMFTRVDSSSFCCLSPPHAPLPPGCSMRHRAVIAKP